VGRGGTVNVTVEYVSGWSLTYGYDPEHAEGVLEYYNDLMSSGDIRSFTVTGVAL
jgi:hypothetical protein